MARLKQDLISKEDKSFVNFKKIIIHWLVETLFFQCFTFRDKQLFDFLVGSPDPLVMGGGS